MAEGKLAGGRAGLVDVSRSRSGVMSSGYSV